MFFSVRELELRKAPFEMEYAPGDIGFEEGLRPSGPIRTKGVAELMSATLSEIRVKGSLDVSMTAECDRCLEPAGFPIATKFDLVYRPEKEARPAEDRHLDEGEADIGFYQGEGLDLKDVIREQIILALPMQRVCRPDCKGMCPTCGQNLNLAECGCRQTAVDDRWAALKQLSKS